MKSFFKNTRFKLIFSILALLLVGALLAGAVGHGETAQSAVVGTVRVDSLLPVLGIECSVSDHHGLPAGFFRL